MCKTIKQKVKLKASPLQVFQLLADSKGHTAFSGAKARMSNKAGGEFSTYAGDISGVNVELVPGKRIVQAWKAKNWPSGIFSMATFNLVKATDGGTELTLIHRGVPKDQLDTIETQWRERYWRKMKIYIERKRL